jgi:chromosome segregation ATPase
MWFKEKKISSEEIDKHNAEVEDLKKKIAGLEAERRELKEEVEDLKLKKKIEDEDIKHMVKMQEERNQIELNKEKYKCQQEKAEEVAAIKDEYRDKIECSLEQRNTELRGMYSEILSRLPDVNVRLRGDVNG